MSQVVLSFGIPFALVPLVIFTRQKQLLGADANRWYTTVAAVIAVSLIIALNFALLWLTFTG
jgi:manganese transport protein